MKSRVEFELNAMRNAYENMQRELAGVQNAPIKPWEVRSEDWIDEEAAAKEALRNMRDRVVDLELQLRDPEQDAEIFAEIAAACAMNGGHDDPYLYMHTPTEEAEFQAHIRHQIDYGYVDEDGGWNEGIYGSAPSTCEWCRNMTFEGDDCIIVAGFPVHDCISDEVVLWAKFCSWAANIPLVSDKYGFSYHFEMEGADA